MHTDITEVVAGLRHDRMGLRDDEPSRSWNASHPSAGCRDPALVKTGGAGLLYCFAVN